MFIILSSKPSRMSLAFRNGHHHQHPNSETSVKHSPSLICGIGHFSVHVLPLPDVSYGRVPPRHSWRSGLSHGRRFWWLAPGNKLSWRLLRDGSSRNGWAIRSGDCHKDKPLMSYSNNSDNIPTLLTKRIQLSASHRCAAPDPRRHPPSSIVRDWRNGKRMLYCRRVNPWRQRLLVIEHGSQMNFHRRDIFYVVSRAFVHRYSAKRATVSISKRSAD
jgi:hypothetical protein